MPQIVTLNVGGTLFQTTRETLITPYDTYFTLLLNSNTMHPETQPTNEFPIFIDRDPAQFRFILNALRGSVLLPNGRQSLLELAEEANFYSMMTLAAKATQKASKGADSSCAISNAILSLRK